MKPKILIVEDQFIEAKSLNIILTAADYFVCGIARSVQAAIKSIDKEKPDIVLVDIFLQGDETGVDLGRFLHERGIAFIYLSANSNRAILNSAKSTHPYGFMVKPFRAKDVLIMLDIALYLHQSRKSIPGKGSAVSSLPASINPALGHMVGNSPPFRKVLELAQDVAEVDTSVLILGESGTGKELIARSIHAISRRKHMPFVVVNCAAIPHNLIESELFGHEKGAFTGAVNRKSGKFEQAEGGTIFLDEVGELPLEQQIRFLRVLQEREIEPIGATPRRINVRVIAATNRDLEEEVASGRFRIDLYYRLNVFPVTMPSLRDRREDIVPLALHFLDKYREIGRGRELSFSPDALDSMVRYHWPGNIRELENTIQRSILLGRDPVIDRIDIPAVKPDQSQPPAADSFKTMVENERDHIIAVLRECKGKVSGKGGAAELLNINVNTLNSRIKKLGIEKLFVKKGVSA